MKRGFMSSTGVYSNRSDGFGQRFSYWGFPGTMTDARSFCAKAHVASLPNAA